MTASLPQPPESASAGSEDDAASVDASPTPPPRPRTPRRPAAASPRATADSDAAAEDDTPEVKKSTPRTSSARNASTGAAPRSPRTPAAKKPATPRTPAAKKPATPRTPAAKKPAAPRKKPAVPDEASPVVDPGPPPPLPTDLVVPPRPPLPPVSASPAVADPTPADVAVEEPKVVEEPPAVESAVDTDTALEEPSPGDVIPSDENATPIEPVSEEPAVDPEPAAVEPVAEEPVADQEPVVVEPVADPEPMVVEPVAEEQVVEDPVPAAQEPVLVADEPEAGAEPAGDEPGTGESLLAEEIAADEASTDDPTPADIAPEPSPVPEQGTDPLEADVTATGSAETPDASAAEVAGAAAAPDAAGEQAVASDVPALSLRNVTKTFGELRAVDGVDLTVPAGSFYGLVGPNGAGKTTTLSIIAGLLRSNGGTVEINGVDAKRHPRAAKKLIGVLPDRLRTFDRLTGRQLLSYYGALRGLPSPVVESRAADLARAFDLVEALGRPVSDYSAGMTKKVMLAGAMIHSPRLLVLDEPFEAVDPVSSGVILDILRAYVDHGGTVILSSHGMELVERVCSRVAVIVSGQVLAEGTVDEVRGESTLEQRFLELSGGLGDVEGLEWLHTFSA